MDAVGLGGAFTGATLVHLGIVLLWVRQRMGGHPTSADPAIQIPAPRANPLPALTGDLDVTRPLRKPTSPERSAALPDWLHQSDAGFEAGKDRDSERGAEDAAVPRAVPRNTDADTFMVWLDSGLTDGSIRVNEARAPVHFVEEGMLLVSPRIFRECANRQRDSLGVPAAAGGDGGADAAQRIQRSVLRARWHLRGIDGANFRSYRLMVGSKGEGRLSGVLIPDPERFVSAVLSANPLLIPLFPENEASA